MRQPLRSTAKFRGLILATLLLLSACVSAHAQATVALDANSGSESKSGSSLTWTHTLGSNPTNAVLLVIVSLNGNYRVSSVSWGGTNPTFSCVYALGVDGSGNQQGNCSGTGSNPARRVEIWGAVLGSPAANTSGTVTVALSGSTQTMSGSASFSGVAQTSTFGIAQGTAGTSGTSTLTLSGLSATGVVVDDIAISTSQPATPDASQTLLWKAANGSSVYGAASYKGGATSITMKQTMTSGSHWAYAAVPINPAPRPVRRAQVVIGRLEPLKNNDSTGRAGE